MEGALNGVKILDLSRVQAGPSCAQMLAFLGADVIKVEDTVGGDNTRWELAHRDDQDSVYFKIFNNNKRAITLNLKTERGKELFIDLVKWADVVLENYSKGVMERLGIGYDVLKDVNPRVIHASIKGFGEYGPWSEFRSFELVAQATAGVVASTGYPDRPPITTSVGVGDSGSGLHMTIGILAALMQRNNTGKGQHVEVSMQDGVFNLLRYRMIRTLGAGESGTRFGNKPSGVSNVFKCHPGGPDDYILIHLPDPVWETLFVAIGREDLIGDERFDSVEARRTNGEEIEAIITEWTSQRTKYEAFEAIAPFGIWCGPVVSPQETLTNEHLIERQMIVNVEDDVDGDYQMIGCPVKLEDTPVTVTAAPRYSQHTDEILTGMLGVADDELDELRQEGVIR